MQHTLITSDGHRLSAYYKASNTPALGNIIVLQEIFGVTEYIKSVCDFWANSGFNTIAPALYDRQQSGAVIGYDDLPAGLAFANNAEMTGLLSDIEACRKYLNAQSDSPVFVLGYCWGGGIAYKAATELTLNGAACVYPTRMPNYLTSPPKCPVQFHFGLQDDHIPASLRQTLTKALPTASIKTYAASHGFDRNDKSTPQRQLRHTLNEFFINNL